MDKQQIIKEAYRIAWLMDYAVRVDEDREGVVVVHFIKTVRMQMLNEQRQISIDSSPDVVAEVLVNMCRGLEHETIRVKLADPDDELNQ